MALSMTSWLSQIGNVLHRDPVARGILDATVTHVRFAPGPYKLTHRFTYLHVPMTDLARLPRLFLARNGFGLFALNDRDYGDGKQPLGEWAAAAFKSAGADVPQGRIDLLTMPRVTGFGFNPVSFWLYHDTIGALSAVLAEVNNTFGERHCYLCRKADGTPIGPHDEVSAEKVFHVSPFMPVDGRYRFRFAEKADRLSIGISLDRGNKLVFTANIAGQLGPLTSATLFKSFIRHPFPTMQVVALIHYHAARLYMSGHKFFSKPQAPKDLVSGSDARTAEEAIEHQ